MFQRIMPALMGALLIVSAAAASDVKPLTDDQTQRFIDTLPALDKLGEELRSDGKTDKLEIATEPKAGEDFKPYSNAVAALKAGYPGDYAKLGAAVKPHGFSADEWGHVGDRVIIAYLALEMEAQDPRSMAMMEGMDASMLQMVPPEMRAQLEATFALMETVKNAPAEDKAVVKKFKPQLDDYMAKSGQN